MSSDLSRLVTSPGAPSPTTQPPEAPSTAPTGVITAAVPQANTSVSAPEAQSSRQADTEMRPSSAGMPSVGASRSRESRVIPGSSEPVSVGVTRRADEPDPYTKYRFIPP